LNPDPGHSDSKVDEITEFLSKVNLFKHCSRQSLNKIAHEIKHETFLKGKVLMKENEDTNGFYIIEEGEIELEKRGDK